MTRPIHLLEHTHPLCEDFTETPDMHAVYTLNPDDVTCTSCRDRLAGHQVPAPISQFVPVDGRGQDDTIGTASPPAEIGNALHALLARTQLLAAVDYRVELFELTLANVGPRPIVTRTKAALALQALQGVVYGDPVYLRVGHQWRTALHPELLQASYGWLTITGTRYWLRTRPDWIFTEARP